MVLRTQISDLLRLASNFTFSPGWFARFSAIEGEKVVEQEGRTLVQGLESTEGRSLCGRLRTLWRSEQPQQPTGLSSVCLHGKGNHDFRLQMANKKRSLSR